MFSAGAKLGASMTGTADNCECIKRDQMNNELSARYLLNDETPFIFLKSPKEEHIFTDRAYISIKGQSAIGLKKSVFRADFNVYPISNVMFETAGMGVTDQDCELKFTIANTHVSIDIRKSEQDTGILYYRALTALAIAQTRQAQQMNLFTQISARTTIQIAEHTDSAAQNRNSQNFSNAVSILDLLSPMSYGNVLEQYISK